MALTQTPPTPLIQLPAGPAAPGQVRPAQSPSKTNSPQPESPQTTIRTTVPLVVVPVSVTDGAGQPVDGLTEENFEVLDDGHPRKVQVEASDAIIAPLSLVIAIQTSDISELTLSKIRRMGAIIGESVAGANGEVAVIGYDDEVKLLRKFTTDSYLITDTFEDLKPNASVSVSVEKKHLKLSGGRMLDAISRAADLLERSPTANGPSLRRTVIVLIGETKDRGSDAKPAEVIDQCQKLATTIFGLSYAGSGATLATKVNEYQPFGRGIDPRLVILELTRMSQKNAMDALVAATGGEYLSFQTKSKLENDLFALSKEIHSRYYVSFIATESDQPQFHRLQISIKGRPSVAVHAKPGYWTGLEGTQK